MPRRWSGLTRCGHFLCRGHPCWLLVVVGAEEDEGSERFDDGLPRSQIAFELQNLNLAEEERRRGSSNSELKFNRSHEAESQREENWRRRKEQQ